jgi:peptide/nickel transport system permease protein
MNESAPAKHARAGLPLRVLLFLGKLLVFFLLLHALVFALFDLLPSAALLQSGWAGVDPALLASTRERLGLSGGWLERYWGSLSHLLHGDLGRSVAGGYPVWDLFASRFRASIPQWIGALVVLALAVPLGVAFCSRRVGPARRMALFLAHGLLIPQFLAAVALYAVWVLGFSPWLPPGLDGVGRLAFAIVSATLLPAAMLFLGAANSARSCAQEPFVVGYLAVGMSWGQIRWRVLRNVLISLRPLLGRVLLGVATGTLFAELTFSIDGVGKLFIDALRSSDFAVMQAWVLFVGAATLTVSLFERRPA